ncbi:MAG: hypothetical protein U9O82_02180 [Thermodesulfobacteriota bacterium]|nr:hypothetical protein [Thermodesulfobacteriota bacterium]
MILSIDESIQRLKAEIIAQDWSLSQKRIELLDSAFSSLKQRFKTRKGIHAILVMADSALDYIKKKKENSLPDAIDFIKEAMAHVVNLYEESDFDPASEEKIFQIVYSRFTTLKTKVKEEKKRSTEPETAPASHPLPVKAAVKKTTIAQVANKTGVPRLQAREMLIASLKMADAVLENKSEVEKLIHKLKTSLERMDGLGITIRQLLKELQAEKKPESVGLKDEEDDNNVGISSATEFRQLVIGGAITAISEENVSLISPVAPAKLENYLKTSNVPLNDFGGFMKKLSSQFKGSLSTVKDRKLKKLSFPVMVPRGFGLPDTPEENAASLVVVSNGQWHGVILCSDVYAEPKTIVRFQQEKNGDISEIGFLDSGDKISILNITSILKREGFLLMV